MVRLLIVRTACTDWNAVKRIQGNIDVPLNDQGRLKAEELSSELAIHKIDAIYSSALCRCFETASIIAQKHGLKPRKCKELNELGQGVWQGLCLEDIKVRYKKQFNLWMSSPLSVKPPQGEDLKSAYDRVTRFLDKVIKKHKGGNVCIVTHEIITGIIKCYCSGLDVNKIWDTMEGIGTVNILDVG